MCYQTKKKSRAIVRSNSTSANKKEHSKRGEQEYKITREEEIIYILPRVEEGHKSGTHTQDQQVEDSKSDTNKRLGENREIRDGGQ